MPRKLQRELTENAEQKRGNTVSGRPSDQGLDVVVILYKMNIIKWMSKDYWIKA